MSVPFRSLALLSVMIPAGAPALAQSGSETSVTLTVAPTFVQFSGFAGGFGAAVAQLRITRTFTDDAGGEIAAFAVIPSGGARAEPECLQGTVCFSLATPSMLNGVVASVYRFLGESGFRAALGGGGVKAVGGDGPGASSSLAGLFGLDWEPRGASRFRPTFGVRLVVFAESLYGARQLVLPGVGIAF